jgi:ABC-type phosphate/phosphonate transport system substrate-binding protein
LWRRRVLLRVLLPAMAVIGPAAADPAARGRPAATLRIGTSSGLASASNKGKEKAARDSLKSLIKDETGLDNEIAPQPSWRELAAKLAQGELQVGVFQGYEFAWAHEKHPELKALALAVNGQRYPVVYVVTRKDNAAADFASLPPQSFAIPASVPPLAHLYVEREARAAGKDPQQLLSKAAAPENAEDALDDAVDGKLQYVVVDRAALEAYKRRKPGRFKQLKPIAQSKPVLPVIIGYYNANLDAAMLKRFRNGLLRANRHERGQTMLTLFRLTGFENVPADFDQVMTRTLQAYPADSGDK